MSDIQPLGDLGKGGANRVSSLGGIPPRWVVSRLTAMMILQYGCLGLWVVTVNSYIAANTGSDGTGIFSPGFIGLAATTGAFGALFAPVLLGIVADHFFSTEKILAVLHALCAICLVGMCLAETQMLFFVSLLVYFQAYAPTGTLTNSLSLRNLPDVDREFPIIRAFGTGGWVLAGVLVGFVWKEIAGQNIEATLVPLKLAAATEAVLAIYCLTLPHTPAMGRVKLGWGMLVGGADLWRNRSFVTFLAISVLVTAPTKFYDSFINPFLNQSHFDHAAAKLTMGQITEMLCMFTLSFFMVRLGLKRMFLIGASAWALRFLLLASSDQTGPTSVYLAVLLHGACFTYVYMTGQLYADRLASRDSRAAAQGYYMLATYGIGHLLGGMIAWWAQSKYLTPEGVAPVYDWQTFWLIPFGLSFIATILFAIFFSETPRQARSNR